MSEYNTRFSEIGSSHFEDFIANKDALLVDKTLLIKDVLSMNKISLIMRPRRFGKTLNMSMLEYFFSIPVQEDGFPDEKKQREKKELFLRMNIGKLYPEIVESCCGQYPVLFVSFKGVPSHSIQAIQNRLVEVIDELYEHHEYLVHSKKIGIAQKRNLEKRLLRESKEMVVSSGIKNLSKMLYTHFNRKVIILFDEYDAPLNHWYADEPEDGSKEILSIFRSLLESTLKDNEFLERGIITGVFRVAKANLFSGLNNLLEASILSSRYAPYFGFTEEEVRYLLFLCGKEDKALDEIRSWYNGYHVGDHALYNPWSIMCYLQEGTLGPYWMGTASTGLLERAALVDALQVEVHRLLEGQSITIVPNPHIVFSDLATSPEAFYNLLLFSGYLTPHTVLASSGGLCEVRIPNSEVRIVFEGFVQKWLSQKFCVEKNSYINFVNQLVRGEITLFLSQLKTYLEQAASYYQLCMNKSEVFYHGFILGLISTLSHDYFVESEKETGFGRADIVIIPKSETVGKRAVILEFKVSSEEGELSRKAKEALLQIQSKKYASKVTVHSHVKEMVLMGIAFFGKQVEAAWEPF